MKTINSVAGKHIIVTGGLGFIGQNLVRELVSLGAVVTVVDDCSNSTPEVLADIKNRISFYPLSVLDDAFLDLITDEIQLIFHLACRTILSCSQEPFNDLRVNAESTLKILEYLRHYKPASFERFVYTSSCSIYGSPKILPVSEDSTVQPLSQYAATKLLGEQYTIMYSRLYDIPVACTRFSNVYGYGQTPRNPYCGVIGNYIDRAFNGEPLVIYGDGDQTRDYTFVTDAVQAAIIAGIHPKAYGEVYNVATNREISVNQLVKLLREHYFPGVVVRHEKERYIDNIRRRVISIAKINQDLSWFPEVTIEEGLHKTIQWYQRRPLPNNNIKA